MPARQVREILDHVREFHRGLKDVYEQIGAKSGDERVQILLDYIARHERNFNLVLKRYEQDAARGVLDTWLRFVPEESLADALRHVELRSDMSVDELIDAALQIDGNLVTLYRDAATESAAPRVRELFESLMEMEEAKDHQVVRARLGLDE